MKIGICSKCGRCVDVAFGLNQYLCADCAMTAYVDASIALRTAKDDKLTDLNKIADNCHRQAVKSGFYDNEKELFAKYDFDDDEKDFIGGMSVSQKLMLIVSELSEKLEAMRKGKKADIETYLKFDVENDSKFMMAFKENIKDSNFDELADSFIRLFDLAGFLGMDLNKHIEWKMRYNSLRCEKEGKRHGKDF